MFAGVEGEEEGHQRSGGPRERHPDPEGQERDPPHVYAHNLGRGAVLHGCPDRIADAAKLEEEQQEKYEDDAHDRGVKLTLRKVEGLEDQGCRGVGRVGRAVGAREAPRKRALHDQRQREGEQHAQLSLARALRDL